MPIGIISNVMAVLLGGVAGAYAGKYLNKRFREKLNMMFGVSSMAMGVNSIILMKNMPAVIFSVIAGSSIGLALNIERFIGRTAERFVPSGNRGEAERAILVTAVAIFCVSGTGFYGVMTSSMSGDESVLIAKSILDLFTAMIFACTLGISVSLIAVPQFVIFMTLYFATKLIAGVMTPIMIADFRACGGIIMLAAGLRMIGFDFPIADMLPSMFLVMPVSYLWSEYVVPLIG